MTWPRRRWWVLAVAAVTGTVGLTTASADRPLSKAPTPPALSTAADGSTAATQALLATLRHAGLRPDQPRPGQGRPSGGGATRQLSVNWSGYVVDDRRTNSYSTVSGTWIQPGVTCTKSEDEMTSFWVGLDGFNSGTVEQDGTLAWCYQGRPYYYTWWEMFPTVGVETVGTNVAPGDHITASVRFTAGAYMLAVTDSSRPANSFSTSQFCSFLVICSNASAEWIAETPTGTRGLWPWPPFGQWRVVSAHVKSGAASGGINAFPSDKLIIVGNDGGSLANTGALDSTGDRFSLTWTHGY